MTINKKVAKKKAPRKKTVRRKATRKKTATKKYATKISCPGCRRGERAERLLGRLMVQTDELMDLLGIVDNDLVP